ncbi:MAG: TIGR01244 family sulfur transferase [Pseudomonadota bacterium]|nr:TIGR01244 family sulfur transferase [Pseudomonadota bacterium]
MEYREISDNYAVSGQILPEDIAAVKAAGFNSVICNRPDDEQPGQPSADSVKQAAEAAGLEFRYIPVVSGQITEQNVADQAAALEGLKGPVFAYCRSGTRCTNLHALIQEMGE